MTRTYRLGHARGPALAAALLLAASGLTSVQAAGAISCPSPAELDEAARTFGTGQDNARRAYAYFLARFGRPASLRQNGNDAEVTYGGGGRSIRISLQRDPASGLVVLACR